MMISSTFFLKCVLNLHFIKKVTDRDNSDTNYLFQSTFHTQGLRFLYNKSIGIHVGTVQIF